MEFSRGRLGRRCRPGRAIGGVEPARGGHRGPGTQAIIDGRVLAWQLARADDPVAGLAAYEHARREPMNALVLGNRRGGPERVVQLVEQRAPHGYTRIEDILTREELNSIALAYRRTAGFDAETLNTAPSWTVSRAS